MSNLTNYRDSSFQYFHLTESHHALYHEWMDDEVLPPPDEVNFSNGMNSESQKNDDGANDYDDNTIKETDTRLRTQYWDYFDDEMDWEIFNRFNLQVESNGKLIYNNIVGQNSDSTGIARGRGDDGSRSDGLLDPLPANNNGDSEAGVATSYGDDERNVITGSLFDPQTLERIRSRVEGWADEGSRAQPAGPR